ncbi:MAG: HlyD family efflux transporter periplasmic adaptor subunit [Thermoanaerobaculia bacterium]
MTTPIRQAKIRDTEGMDVAVERQPRRWKPWAVVASGVVLLAFWWLKPIVGRWTQADQSVELARLRLATVTRGDLVHDVAAQGRVVAASRPTLFSPAAGIVTLRVRGGAAVTAGELLAVVASPELENRLQQERATLAGLTSDAGRLELSIRQQNLANLQRVALGEVQVAAAAREVERAERLAGLGLLNQIDLEKSRDTLAIGKLELEQSRQRVANEKEMFDFQLRDAHARSDRQQLVARDVERQIGELEIRAPFAGQVATVTVTDADAVVRGQPLLGVVDLSDLEIEINIPETYADQVAIGVPAVVRIDTTEVPGVLTSVAPEVRNAQVEGRITFDGGPPAGLRQNQRVSCRLVLDRRSGVLKVPRGPFLEAGGGRQIYVVADGLARRRAVTLGAVSVTEVEILSGVEEGEQVVLSDLGALGAGSGAETLLIRD